MKLVKKRALKRFSAKTENIVPSCLHFFNISYPDVIVVAEDMQKCYWLRGLYTLAARNVNDWLPAIN